MLPLRCLIRVVPLLFVLLYDAVDAVEIDPFHTQNQSPLIQIYGLPGPTGARILQEGRGSAELTADVASNFAIDTGGSEKITLDGESYRFTVGLRYGIGEGFEAGIELPYVVYSGGFLDSFIEHFHEFFSLPDGNRSSAPHDRLLFNYVRDGQEKLSINRANSGFGDMRLTAGWQLYKEVAEYPLTLAIRASLKLPTGNSGKLHGSGSTDTAVWLEVSDDFSVGESLVTLFGSAGGLGMSKGDVLPDQQRPFVAFGSLGVGWSPIRALAVKAQVNAHTSFYTGSHLNEVGSGSGQIVLGGTFALPAELRLDAAVTEDFIVLSSSPDVVFHLAIRREF